MVKGDWIKEGAAVIDVGINSVDVSGGGGVLVVPINICERRLPKIFFAVVCCVGFRCCRYTARSFKSPTIEWCAVGSIP